MTENNFVQYEVPKRTESVFNINNQSGMREFLVKLIEMNAVTLEGLELICKEMLLPQYLIEEYKNMYYELNGSMERR